jgi:DNA-binding Xre family transcriptional regulator
VISDIQICASLGCSLGLFVKYADDFPVNWTL